MTRELLMQLHIGAVLFVLYLGVPIAALLLIAALLERVCFREEATHVKQLARMEIAVQDAPEAAPRS
jgi:hypothetical protein